MTSEPIRPPSVDALARELAANHGLPHAILVDCARQAISASPHNVREAAHARATEWEQSLLVNVVNATGVLLHTNLGRAPLTDSMAHQATNVEFNMANGERGSRHDAISHLLQLCIGSESAIVVNNNAAAVMLVLAALANNRDVAVSRGESVEIGGGFRIPDVMEQSGARLVDVGTTNKTRLADYQKAISSAKNDVALVMKIHPSNFAIQGFTESTSMRDLSTLEVPVVADIGSGLLDNSCPWLHGHLPTVPAWLSEEPAAKQSLADGAALVTFSGDKLLGGPQCGIIAGNTQLVDACAAHPLMRALRPGGHTLATLQSVLLSYCNRSVCEEVPFWNMLVQPVGELHKRASTIVTASGQGEVIAVESLIGAGSAPGTSVPSCAIAITGDHRVALRRHRTPIIARVIDGATMLDLRSVHPDDDLVIIEALTQLS